MSRQIFFIVFIILILGVQSFAQTSDITAIVLKQEISVLPGEVINLPISIKNSSTNIIDLNLEIILPEGWKTILDNNAVQVSSNNKVLLVYSIQASVSASVGKYPISIQIKNKATNQFVSSAKTLVEVEELEDISMMLVSTSDYVIAGEMLKASYLLRNEGNTTKRIYLETFNCEIKGQREVELKPDETVTIDAMVTTDVELTTALRKYFTVKAVSSTKVYENVYQPYTVFPSGDYKIDLYHRFPVKASASYLYSNQYDNPISGYQFELSGSGTIDAAGKHHLEFLARGPDNNRFGFMGLYNQYYISYRNKNVDLTVGERTYQFTPLTEASRYGLGAETRVSLDNGIRFGVLAVKPRFYEEIENEIASYAGFAFDKNNWFDLYYISKATTYSPDRIHLTSINGSVAPFKRTNLEFEYSRGLYEGEWDDAYRANLISHFSIFQFAGNYFNTGENYPGYYNNSKFYSANLSAKVTNWMNVGVYVKEDFQNAQLDTFFINAPYSKAYHAYMGFKIARQGNLRLFWRNYERKDRLSDDKFHYETQSLNAQYRQRFKSLDYNILAEYGETTNLKSGEVSSKQNTYRLAGNIGYRLNKAHTFQFFGSWSNVNSFISDEERNLTIGVSVNSRLGKNIYAMLYLQNAYDIDEYYNNRNLMQFSLDYSFLNNHKISARSYYTLFKTETEDPNLTLSLEYAYHFGVPTAKAMLAGSFEGTIVREDGSPIEGVRLNLLNNSALTDNNGYFIFNLIPPGRHLLFIDNSGFAIDEILNIKAPIEIDIIGDRKSNLNLKVTKGARLQGQFISKENVLKLEGIIVELKNEFEQFRISTKTNGQFSFPLVRPGNYSFKVFKSSLPDGYETEQSEFNLELENARNLDVQLELIKKERKIKFSSQSFVLTPKKQSNSVNNKKPEVKELKSKVIIEDKFYSVQIGGFGKRKMDNSPYFEYRAFDIEVYSDNLYKYFIGKFTDEKEAHKLKTELRKYYKGAFVVIIDKGKVVRE